MHQDEFLKRMLDLMVKTGTIHTTEEPMEVSGLIAQLRLLTPGSWPLDAEYNQPHELFVSVMERLIEANPSPEVDEFLDTIVQVMIEFHRVSLKSRKERYYPDDKHRNCNLDIAVAAELSCWWATTYNKGRSLSEWQKCMEATVPMFRDWFEQKEKGVRPDMKLVRDAVDLAKTLYTPDKGDLHGEGLFDAFSSAYEIFMHAKLGVRTYSLDHKNKSDHDYEYVKNKIRVYNAQDVVEKGLKGEDPMPLELDDHSPDLNTGNQRSPGIGF